MNVAAAAFQVTRQVVVSSETEEETYDLIRRAVSLEPLGPGRWGAVAVRCGINCGSNSNDSNENSDFVPLVRSTTVFQQPPVLLPAVLERILPPSSNNALIEVYDAAYRKMGFHSDQMQDLADDSTIAIFSWYRDPDLGADRQLVVRQKEAPHETLVIPLEHNSVVRFTTMSNRLWQHKIVVDPHHHATQQQKWMGVTARTAKTFVRFSDGVVLVVRSSSSSGREGAEEETLLRLATTDAEKREIYRRRREENRAAAAVVWQQQHETDTTTTTTLSPSDRMMPVAARRDRD